MKFEEAKKLIEELDSGLMSCNMDYEGGFSDAKDRVLEILDEIDTEPVGISDKMTLRELARELRKIFRFRYLTVEKVLVRTHKTIPLWVGNKPPFYSDKAHEWFALMSSDLAVAFTFEPRFLNSYFDLSEYKDENGNIDYSKCIVEVE